MVIVADLVNEQGDHLTLHRVTWKIILTLASQHGWKAAGTKKPKWVNDYDHWDGGYSPNGGQLVTPEDAQAIAEALKTALRDGVRLRLLGVEWEQLVACFIPFCEKGAFLIC